MIVVKKQENRQKGGKKVDCRKSLREEELMEGKLYRFHRTTGTVHYIPGCCRFGDVSNPNVHADNFDECYTYEEAENILKHRHRGAHQCKRCVFPSEKGGK